jgi:hypothetical protein
MTATGAEERVRGLHGNAPPTIAADRADGDTFVHVAWPGGGIWLDRRGADRLVRHRRRRAEGKERSDDAHPQGDRRRRAAAGARHGGAVARSTLIDGRDLKARSGGYRSRARPRAAR